MSLKLAAFVSDPFYLMWKGKTSDAAIRRLAVQAGGRLDRLMRVAAADDAGRPPFPRDPAALKWLAAQAERLRVADAAPKPLLAGRDLVALGMKPGPAFGRILKTAYEAQLDGRFDTREKALAYLNSLREKRIISP